MVDHLHETQLRLDSVDFRAEQFIDQNLTIWAEETIVSKIEEIAKSIGVPEEYLNSVQIVKSGWMKVEVILDYTKDGKPLGIWFENGTEAHGILGNPFLRFFWEKIQKWVVLRKVKHPGTKAHHIMQRAEDEGMNLLAGMIPDKTTNYLREVMIP